MKALLLSLLMLTQAGPDTVRWRWGETAREAIDRVLAAPGWTLHESSEQQLLFTSNDGKRGIIFDLSSGLVTGAGFLYPEEAAAQGRYLLEGATQLDASHWRNDAAHAYITRQYSGNVVCYMIECVP